MLCGGRVHTPEALDRLGFRVVEGFRGLGFRDRCRKNLLQAFTP